MTIQGTIQYAEILKSQHDHAAAVKLVQRAIVSYPDNFALRMYAGNYYLYVQRRDLAFEQFREAVRLDTANLIEPACDFKSLALFLRTATEIGRYSDVCATCAELDLNVSNPDAVDLLAMYSSHAELALRFDPGEIDRAFTALKNSDRYLSTGSTMRSILAAIKNARGFSMIRLGDGEARFMAYCDKSVQLPDRPAIVDAVWKSWFGKRRIDTFDRQLIEDLARRFDGALETADVIGIPVGERLAKDKLHYGYLAYLLDRLLCGPMNVQQFTDADVNFRLLRSVYGYHPALSGQRFLGVVSCHEGLAAKPASRYSIPTMRSYSVPGEQGRPQLPDSALYGEHFPHRFREVLNEIEVPFPGSVFLVGAGLLGKIYCARIKALGGIALDIGSVADAWSGFNTRPGSFDAANGFAL